MVSWLDVAYVVLDLLVIFYCFGRYYSSKKRPFQLLGFGFIFLLISDFLWVFAIPWLNGALSSYSYIRLGLYAVFIVLTLQALQSFDKKPEATTKQAQ